MTSNNPASHRDLVVGQTFSRNYLKPSALLPDSQEFRTRTVSYLVEVHKNLEALRKFLAREAGVKIVGNYPSNYIDWFNGAEVRKVLDVLTYVWRHFDIGTRTEPDFGNIRQHFAMQRDAWHGFVSRVFSEEHLGYKLDAKCGVHYLVDSEYERNKVSSIQGLGEARYSGALDAINRAYAFMDMPNPDTKSAVRSAFESVEIVARLIVPEAQNLNKRMLEEKIKPIAVKNSVDEHHKAVLIGIFDGLALFINGLHHYRHGQGAESVVQPPSSTAVYAISTASTALRMLVEVDKSNRG